MLCKKCFEWWKTRKALFKYSPFAAGERIRHHSCYDLRTYKMNSNKQEDALMPYYM